MDMNSSALPLPARTNWPQTKLAKKKYVHNLKSHRNMILSSKPYTILYVPVYHTVKSRTIAGKAMGTCFFFRSDIFCRNSRNLDTKKARKEAMFLLPLTINPVNGVVLGTAQRSFGTQFQLAGALSK